LSTGGSPRADSASETVLSPRALNRALLARQFLLVREKRTAIETIEHLVGMQAQVPSNPYLGLWARLDDFQPEEVSRLIERRELVRPTLMRTTIHLVSARDCLALRPLMQPLMVRTLSSTAWGKNIADAASLAGAVSYLVPVVQVPPMPAGRGAEYGSVLVDGFLGGMWRITRKRGGARLVVESGGSWSQEDRKAAGDEGARMLACLAADAGSHDVRIVMRE